MKVKNSQINPETSESMKALMSTKLPVAISFRMVKIARKYDELAVDLDEAMKIVREEFFEKDEEGKFVHPLDENGEAVTDSVKITDPEKFKAKVEELQTIENDIDLEAVKIDELGDIEIKPETLLRLDWLIA